VRFEGVLQVKELSDDVDRESILILVTFCLFEDIVVHVRLRGAIWYVLEVYLGDDFAEDRGNSDLFLVFAHAHGVV